MKYKKHIYLPVAIFIYAIVMTVVSYKQNGVWTKEMSVLLLVETAITILLYFLLKKRDDNLNK